MKITPRILECIYLMLASTEVFAKWDMPPSELIKFEIVDDYSVMATYQYDESEKYPHVISISKARCGHLSTLISSMAHEMVHCSRWESGKWTLHDSVFKSRKMKVARSLGIDPLEL